MDDKKGDEVGPTLAADPVRGAPGDHGPLAAGSKPGGDDTMPAGEASSAGASGGLASDSGARAGRPSDYTTLLPVNPAHYVRERELARGGMGRIIVARDRRLGREVAIKEVHVNDAALRIRFEREARITARLQHPSTIGLLEAGVWPTGEPFYAMPLVAGRPLDKVIADAKTVDARFGLIANVVAVADTLAHAHSRRIVHRDLKPANVLVGEFGETVVIDWGLAKDLNVAGDDSLRPSAPSVAGTGSQSGQTEHGTVIGTPAFMPPEQADGNPVDERADVYALGALLYTVLAGRAPYLGRSAEGVLADVLFGPPPRLATLVPEAPPDLITIVEKAMARDPADRFPTAKELAVELKKFQTGQLVGSHRYTLGELLRRWIRKYRLTIAVAAAAVVALAAIGAISIRNVVHARRVAEHERVIADEQRESSAQSSAEARELLRFMMGDLHEKLDGVGRLDLLESVAAKVIGYYDRRGREDVISDHLQRAEALETVGDVQLARGDLSGARASYEKARGVHQDALSREPTSIEAASGLARSYTRLGDVAATEGDTKTASAAYREALRGAQAAIARDPTQPGLAIEMLQAQRGLGDSLVELGDGPGAAAAYRAGIEIAKAGRAKSENDSRWLRGLAVLHSQLGALLLMQGDAEGALREQREDVTLSEQFAAVSPHDTNAQNGVAAAHLRLGDLFNASGDSVSALAEFRSSLGMMKHLRELDPTNADWIHDLTACHDRVGNVLLARGDTAGARVEYEASRALRQDLIARDPKSIERRNLGVSHNKLGNVLETEKKFPAALAEYERALPIFEALALAAPADGSIQRDLSVSLFLTADMLLATGRRAAALERHRRSLAISVALHAKDPTNAIWQGDEIEGHGAVAKVLVALGEKADALAEYKLALALAEAAAAKEADNPQWASYVKDTKASIKACCAKLR
jgi:tetratricopeptide (TPR) repeat protein